MSGKTQSTQTRSRGIFGRFRRDEGGTIDLATDDSGTYASVLFYLDPDGPTGTGASTTQKFNGGNTMELTGALYFPTQKIE